MNSLIGVKQNLTIDKQLEIINITGLRVSKVTASPSNIQDSSTCALLGTVVQVSERDGTCSIIWDDNTRLPIRWIQMRILEYTIQHPVK